MRGRPDSRRRGRPSAEAASTTSRVRKSEPLAVHGAPMRPETSRRAPSAAGSAARARTSASRASDAVRRAGSRKRSRAFQNPALRARTRPARKRTRLFCLARATPAADAMTSAAPRARGGGTGRTVAARIPAARAPARGSEGAPASFDHDARMPRFYPTSRRASKATVSTWCVWGKRSSSVNLSTE